MRSNAISICIVFQCTKAGRLANWLGRQTGARAGGRMGSNVTGQLMTLIYLNICVILLPIFLSMNRFVTSHYLYYWFLCTLNSLCLNHFSLRKETFNEFLSKVNLSNFLFCFRRRPPPSHVRPEPIINTSLNLYHYRPFVISTRQRRMSPRSRRNRLCRNDGSSDSCFLLSPVVICRSSLFVDRVAV